ncbi:hypothetical protein N0V90_012027 [Kalmusia sp. IMI 367209]|nr:hypothetical protein N0V90_012027 [Kalmusia sp. IMI 367209]
MNSMNLMPMDGNAVRTLMSTVDLIATTLDTAHDSWRDHLQAIRSITAVLEFSDSSPDSTRKQWQLPLIAVFQRVAYADADSGGVPDVGNWCLKQAVTLLQVYPEDVDLLTLIGRNWLFRAQKSLANIHLSEQSSTSSGGSQSAPLSTSEEHRQVTRANVEAESRLYLSDYVEARGILLPAVEYLKRAAEAARVQEKITGDLLSTVSTNL